MPLDNLSAEDVLLEQEYLKSQHTSSPKQPELDTPNDDKTMSHSSSSIIDDEKQDPTYGIKKKQKPSFQPGRKPSASRITAQKIIIRTKGIKPPAEKRILKKPGSPSSKNTPVSTNKKPESSSKPVRKQPKHDSLPTEDSPPPRQKFKSKYGLKIMHHGIIKQPPVKHGCRCVCEVYGGKVS